MDLVQKSLLNELIQGKELSNMLLNHLHPSSSPETRLVLLDKILCSYEKTLSMLNCSSNSVVETKPSASGSMLILESPGSIANSSQVSDKKDVCKKR